MKKRILYFCSYVPYKLLENAGFEMVSAHSTVTGARYKNSMSGNLCCFMRNCVSIDFTLYDGVIFTNCCNSTQRLYDYVTYHYPKVFTYFLEIPRDGSEEFDSSHLFYQLEQFFAIKIPVVLEKNVFLNKKQKEDILILSSCIQPGYMMDLQKLFADYHLTGETCMDLPRGDLLIINKIYKPCVRSLHIAEEISESIKNSKAVIFVSMQRCDQIMYLYPVVKQYCESQKRRILYVEEEYSIKISERSKIRYEAFLESLRIGENIGK